MPDVDCTVPECAAHPKPTPEPKHECCEQAVALLSTRHFGENYQWHIRSFAISHCPFCGSKLPEGT